jgi:hypothetical protein
MSVKRKPTNIQQTDVVEVFSREVRVSVDRNNDDSRAICTVDSEHLVYDPVVISSLFAVLESWPPVGASGNR